MTDDRATFLTVIDRLTKEHPGWVERDTGREMRTQNGLLEQIREAVFGGMNGSGTGAAYGSKLTIDATAADLLDEIDRQAAEALASVDPRPTPLGTTESYVRLWAGQTKEDKMLEVTVKRERQLSDEEMQMRPVPPRVYFERTLVSAGELANRWADRIEEYFDPPSTREIKAPCPSCDTRYMYRMVDGLQVRSAALNFIRDKTTGRTIAAKCSACGNSWAPPMFDWLARHIGATPLPEMVSADTPSD